MTWVVAGRTLAPVAGMTRRVRELSATNLDARVPVPPSGDEIAELAETMNAMLERLEKAATAQLQFVSDASHELRSPVASIRAQLETALAYLVFGWLIIQVADILLVRPGERIPVDGKVLDEGRKGGLMKFLELSR